MPEISEIVYNSNAGRYVYADSRQFVPNAVIDNLLDQEIKRLETRLAATTRLLADDKLTLAEWQTRFATTLRDAHIQIGALASGGKNQMGSQQYGAIGFQLRRQYQYLDGFAQDLQDGKLTAAQALSRSRQYGSSINTTFHRLEQVTRQSEGFNEAKRGLDPQARHCASCPGYSTNGEWRAIDQVVSPGVNCECGQRCRCPISYRRNPNVLNQPGVLAA